MYIPELGIFGQHDPLSGKTLDPYGYAYQNPIFFTDPTGLEGDPVPGSSGTGNPQSIGTAASPIDVGEVILNSPVKAVASNIPSIMPSNCLVCNGGGISAPKLQNTATPNIPEIRRSYKNFYPYQPDNTPEWYTFGGRANWGLGGAALSLEKLSGQTRITTTGSSIRLYRPNANGNVFIKNQYTKTMGLGKIGNLLGKASFWGGVAMDARGAFNYYYNPESTNIVHPAKAGLNTTIGAYGTWVNPAAGILYFGVDAFYPGGWEGYGNDYQSIQSDNAAIMPGFITAPYGSQKF
ncbi:hypothetical protein J2772_004948 [Chryseobacterium jejuense]|nr:hypothetical protein [Chryseobacterium jejuense]